MQASTIPHCYLACSTSCSNSICPRAAPSSSTCLPFCCCCGGLTVCSGGKQRERHRVSHSRFRTYRSDGGQRLDHASSFPLVGAAALARLHRLLFCASRLSGLRCRASDRNTVCVVARSRTWLRRHHHARSCGVLRCWSLYRRITGLPWHLD